MVEVGQIRADNRSGATALTERGAALLAAAVALPPAEYQQVAQAVACAQPAMASLLRLANAVLLAAAAHPEASAVAARRAAEQFLSDLRDHAAAAVPQGAALAQGRRVLTHSASSLVAEALQQAHAAGGVRQVTCTESRPAGEGVTLARRLGEAGLPVRLVIDAAAASLLPECDLVLLGADTVCAEGLVHKIGTLGLALAAQNFGVPVYALATDEKLLPVACGPRPPIPLREGTELLPDPAPGVTVLNRYFDLTPPGCLSAIVCESGLLRHRALTRRLKQLPVHPSLRHLFPGGQRCPQ
ncbi:MAG: hypothetical protein GX774_21665 [Armatimonadetes bacterium]|nr:hypothetical protein [Armatimonadota bacterium]